MVPHVADVLGKVDKIKKIEDINHVSNIIKQNKPKIKCIKAKSPQILVPIVKIPQSIRPCYINKFSNQF